MTLDSLPFLLAVAANVHAIAVVVVVLVRRTVPAPTLRRLAKRCDVSLIVFIAFSIFVFLRGMRQGSAAVDPSQKASLLANAISEGMNCAALLVPSSIIPIVVALWLRRRARRAP